MEFIMAIKLLSISIANDMPAQKTLYQAGIA
jgi:hypothetical protein